MSMWSNVVYTAAGQDLIINEFIRKFVYSIADTFPNRMYSKDKVFIDLQGLVENPQKDRKGTQNPRHIKNPKITVNIGGGANDIWSRDNQLGTDNKVLELFHGNGMDKRLNSPNRKVMLKEPYNGIMIDTSEERRGVDLEMKFDFDSKADLIMVKSYLYNTFPIRKWAKFESNTVDLILPNLMIHDLCKLIIDYKRNCLHDPRVLKVMLEYLRTFGFFDFDIKYNNIDPNDYKFIMTRTNRYPYWMEIEDEKDGANANQEDISYRSFSFTMRAKISMDVPFAYVMNVKTFNATNKVLVDEIFLDNNRLNDQALIPVKYNPPTFIDDRQFIYPCMKANMSLLLYEDFFVDPVDPKSGEDYLNIAEFLPLYRKDEMIIFFMMMMFLTPEEREDLFEVQIYMNTVLMDKSNVKLKHVGPNIIVDMKNLDTTVSYVCYFYWDSTKIRNLLHKVMIPRLEKGIYPNGLVVPGVYPEEITCETLQEVLEYGWENNIGDMYIDVKHMSYPVSGSLPAQRAIVRKDRKFATMLPRLGGDKYLADYGFPFKWNVNINILREDQLTDEVKNGRLEISDRQKKRLENLDNDRSK